MPLSQEERAKVYQASSQKKMEFTAINQQYVGATWRQTTDRKHLSVLDASSNMMRTTYAIVGAKVCVTHNIVLPSSQLIPNGASGIVTEITESGSVVVDIEKPCPAKHVTFNKYACLYRTANPPPTPTYPLTSHAPA